MRKIVFIASAASMVVSNYGYQLFTSGNYAVALERSWFQITALVVAWFCLAMADLRSKRLSGDE